MQEIVFLKIYGLLYLYGRIDQGINYKLLDQFLYCLGHLYIYIFKALKVF